MAKALTQTGSVGLTQSATRRGEFGLLSDSEIIILAVKPSLCYVLFVSARWLAVLLPVTIISCLSAQMGWFDVQARVLLAISLTAIIIRLAFALLQWQSRAYILTNLRVLRIRGVMRIEMFQCSLLQLKNVQLTAGFGERILGLGTIGMVRDSSGSAQAHWRNMRRPEQVRRKIIEAIDSLKGRSSASNSADMPPATTLPAKGRLDNQSP